MVKRTKKEQELHNYLERINDIMWEKFMLKSYVPTDQDAMEIMEVLEEWANNE